MDFLFFKNTLLESSITDSNKVNTSKTANVKAIADYVDNELDTLSDYITSEINKLTSSLNNKANTLHGIHVLEGGLKGEMLKRTEDGYEWSSNPTDYEHPATHPATMIEEDETHRFVTDEEKAQWGGVA